MKTDTNLDPYSDMFRPLERKKTKHVTEKHGCNSALLKAVVNYLFVVEGGMDSDDVILESEVARHLKSRNVDIGMCLASLVKDGVLIRSKIDRSIHDDIIMWGTRIRFHEGKWVQVPHYPYDSFQLPIGREQILQSAKLKSRSRFTQEIASKKEADRFRKKNPYIEFKWNEYVYHIVPDKLKQLKKISLERVPCKRCGSPVLKRTEENRRKPKIAGHEKKVCDHNVIVGVLGE